MYRAVESFLREKSKIGCPWLVYGNNIVRGLKFFHFLMLFTAKSERELSANSIVSFHFSHTN
jgi:hypothetical protein